MFRLFLRSLLAAVTIWCVFLAYVLSWEDPATIATVLAIALSFYMVTLAITIWLRRPLVCAITWIACRLAIMVPFGILAWLQTGEEGFVLFVWSFAPDLPILPLLRFAHHPLESYCGERLRDSFEWLVYLAWYGGGGYLAGRWASAQRSKRLAKQEA